MELTITEKEEKSIALNMIVKNESHIIEKTLQNLCEYISFDYWVICDTGSTDGTQNLIKKFFKAKNIKGELHQCDWKDFGHNRTEALEKAFNKTDYLLIFDADDSIQGDFNLPTQWKYDSYSLKFGNITTGEVIYKRVLLINNRKKYAFHGVLHEFIVGISDNITETCIKGDYYLISGREGSRSQNPNKYLDDALILEKGFNEEINDESLKHRYAFYCAQSYKDAGKTDKSIYWFQKALTLPIWTQEKYYSCYQLGYLYEKKGEDEKAIHYWLKTSQYDPERIEGIVSACNKYKDMGLNEIAVSLYSHYSNYAKWTTNLYDKLFVEVNRYQQELEYHCSIAAGYTRDKKCGYECCKTILLRQQQPPHVLKCTIHNLQYYKKFLEEDPDSLQLFYAVDNLLSQIESTKICFDIWMFLFMQNREKMTKLPQLTIYPCNKDKPFIFLSFTTCKRWDLFQQTMNSILNHWGDYNKIEYWFCVDDNSSQEDRTVMETTYPWIDYYMKTAKEKGHRESMNIIWDKLNQLKPTYWIHMEDDFLFHRKYNYVEQGIACLHKYKDKNVKQVLFNRGYGEIIEDYTITSYIPLDEEFSLHDHKQGHFSTRNCHYWPYYSFRPSIIEVDSILKLGNYDSHNQFFEMDYANRWNDSGYKSAFFNCITNRHIGRLTSQRNNKELPNAYELNNEGQFERITPFIKIINLERRADRKKSTIDKLEKVDCYKYTFIKATDGISLTSTHEIKTLFHKNDFSNNCAVIGCALSHYYLWKSLIEDERHDFYLIMEDDFTLCEGFKEKIEGLKTEMKNKEILLLGYHMFEKEREKVREIYDCSSNNVQVSKLNSTYFVGGTFSYSINTKGAQLLIDYIEKNGIQHGIDYVIGKLNNKICYETQPHLCSSLWDENDKPVDSDIKNNTRALDLTEPHIHIINLERRKDRKKKMIEKLDENNITNYDFFKACDGTTIIPTYALKQLFEGNDFNNNRGTIGCAMSHLTLWKRLLQDDDNAFYLILEDDITFTNDYSKKFNQICEFDQKDIIFLGYSMMEAERNKSVVCDISNTTLQLNKLNKTRYIGGFFSYLINKNGAKKLVDYIDKNGIKYGIDYLIKKIDTLDCYEVSPQLTFTKWNEDAVAIDSDIQGGYTRMEFPKNEFIFVQGLDQIGNDLYHQRASIERCIQRSDKDEKCVGFNTLGFFKDKIDCLTPSPYFGEEDGIYIKKEYYEKYQLLQKKGSKHETNSCKRVKMLCNWLSSEQLCKKWSNMCEEDFRWKDIEITSEDDNIDYYVIINKPQKGAKFDPKKTVVFQMEPWVEDTNKNWGVKTWGEWANPNPNDFLAIRGRKTDCYNNVFWQLELNCNELKSLTYNEKLNTVSSICSSKYYDVGHKHRIDFLKFLEKKGDIALDIYNKDNKHTFKNYKGPLRPYIDKSKGIVPYKYYFMVENNYERNFITEKLWEPILCETLIFYYGCPNIKDYINEKAFVQLDMNDFEKSYEIIKKAIKEDWWSQRIDIIRAEKKKILNEMGFFPTLQRIITNSSLKYINFANKDIPIVLICYNNHKYIDNTINQISKINPIYYKNIIVINNSSNNSETLRYLAQLRNTGIPVINNANVTPRISDIDNIHIYNQLPERFILSDPDLTYNKNLPSNFITNLLQISEKYKRYKVGFALDISDFNKMYQSIYIHNMTIYDWEKVNWKKKIIDKNYELYEAGIDTTFCIINKKFVNNKNSIRVAGDFTCKHIPWYMDNKLYSHRESQDLYKSYKLDIGDTKKQILNESTEENMLKITKNNRKPKDNYKRVKMLCNWSSSEELCKKWSTMCDEDLHWKDIEITSEDENIDYYVIINKPQKGAKFDPKKTLIFQMEPWIYNATKDWGVHTWGKWSRPDEKKFLYVGGHKNYLNAVQWEITVPSSIPEERENKAITFLSAKKHDWGHKKRIEFLKKLEDWQKGEEGRTSLIDIYGRENYHSLTHYKGPLKDDKKENHFIHYKYCFAVENNSERNYATEKIWEPILCECLTFYWGCPGLEKHINEKAFVRLNITDFEGSLAIIQQAIKEDWWSQRIDIIRQEKQRLINELGFFPRLREIIKDRKKK